MMSYLTSRIRAGSTLIALLFLSLLLPGRVQAQFPTLPAMPTSCSYTTAPATVSLTASAASSGFNTTYLLVDMTSGIIVKANTSAPVFTAVPAGVYYAVAAHYTGGLNNASAGNLISQVYSSSQCLSYGTPLALKVCNASSICDFQSAPASVTFTASNVPSGVNTTYVLVDESTNTIVKTSPTASFSAVAVGDYAITSVHYSGSLTALAAGNRLYDVVNNAANCRNVSQPLRIRVCNSPLVITSPAPGATVASLNPPVSGSATPGSSVTVTGGPGSTGGPCTAMANASGIWSCTSLTFTAGPSSITATNGVTSAVNNFTAATTTTLAVNPPVPGPLTQPVSGTTTPGNIVSITGPGNVTLCSTTASSSGTFSCPITLPTGPTSVTVTTTGPGGTSTSPVTVTAVAPPTVAVNGPSGIQTSTSPTVSGTATPGSVVSITGPGNATLCSTTASVSGTFSCPITVSTGPSTLTVTAANPGGVATTTTSFTAVPAPRLIIDPLFPGPVTQPITGTVTPGTLITITGPGNVTLCSTTASSSGTFSCPITLPTGPTSVTVTTTGPGGVTTTPITVTAVASPTVAVNGPSGIQTSTSPTVSGTATPGSVVSITGPGNATLCSTTASVSGTFSCSVSVPTGPATLTVTAVNPGGVATTTTSFTAVPAPSLAINPPVPGPVTQPITGTATPGTLVSITGPGNATLCSTTASSSGAFSCPITLPTGPTTLTVTTTGPGGTSTSPVTVTAVASPTVAVNGPSGIQTSTSPTVSGTATPGSVVSITGPGNATLCSTTASVSGAFSCSVSVPTGPSTLTVTAVNPGGVATTTTSFTAVPAPRLIIDPLFPGPVTQPITGTVTPGTLITITGPGNVTLCSTTASSSGTFSCPITLPTGPTSVTVTTTGPGGTSTSPVTVTAVASPTVAVNGPSGIQTSTSPTVSGTATPGSVVSVTGPGNTTLCSTTASVSGAFSCSVSVPTGPATLTVTAVNPGGVATTTTSFTAVPAPSLAINPPVPGPVTQPITGTATPGTLVSITGPGNATLCSTTASSSGAFSCPITLPTGPTTLTVTTTGPGGTSTSPVTVTAVASPTVAVNGPSGIQTSTSPTVSGTATPGSVVSITGPGNATLCSTTASVSGAFSCSVSVPTGPSTLTVTAVNPGGVATTTTSFTAVPAPRLIIDPLFPGPVTQPITGTVTPGTLITITGPGNVTLCSTTASSSGTFSCPITLPTGPTSVTVTTTGPGGVTTTPITVTAVASPTVAVNGPSGIQTSTSPTVSGTATPGSVVSITGPGNATLCSTTASVSGTFSCSVSVPTGPATLTVTAVNPGGVATTTTSFTAVPAPSLAINPPVPGPVTQPITGTATPGTLVSITGPGNATLCSTTASSSGAFSCPITLPTGPTTLTVTTTGPGGTSTSPVTVTAVASPTVAVNGPSGIQTSTSPTVSGTATPGSVVSITGPGNATLCSTTASVSGAFSCSVSVPTGPSTLTVTAVNPGGVATTTTSFTAVPAPRLIIDPLFPGPVTQPITGTVTPGTLITITGPGNVTLCSTTASSSGTFSCPITLPTGPTSVTVTTTGPGGTSTSPVTVTAVASPTVAVNGPSGIQTSTSPTVSGTATPGSVVSVTGPGNTTLCSTTASVSGAFSCSVSVPTGPATLTVTAVNPGGVATTTTSFTAVPAPSLAINPPVPGPVTQPITGTATPGTLVSITGPGNVTLCSTTASSSGAFSCPITLPTGPTTLTVTTTGPGGTSTSPVTVTAVASPTVAVNGPSGIQTSTSPVVSGTATPGSVVSITGPGNVTLCSTTASVSGAFSCSVSVPTGPATLTVTAANPGGVATTTTSFTAVPAPSLTVATTNTLASTTPTISGTATPGSQITITGPGNATLCSTIASLSGTFACSLSSPLPTGPATLTVSAAGPGGMTTQPVTLTLVNPTPTISAQPIGSQTACIGGIATLSVSASASVGNLLYQWQSASLSAGPFANITGATSATYNASSNSAGDIYYRVLVSNTESGTITSGTAVVTTVGPPSITVQPTATQTVCAGSPVSLSVTASGGTGTLTYQWQSASSPGGTFTPINSATLASYNVPTATAATTYFRVLVSSGGSGCGTATSSVVNVVVNAQPTIAGVSPANPSTCATNTGSITLSGMVPSATHTISYSKNGGSVNTATLVADASGNVVLNGLGAGTYTGITATIGSCVSAPYTATVTLTDPVPAALAANQLTAYSPTACGTNTGRIEITGLPANTGGLLVSYSRNGSPATITLSTDGSGKATISSLPAGSYAAFTVQTGSCTTAPFAGPVTIADPGLTALSAGNVSSTSPTSCGAPNGTITLSGLPANTALTISYQKGGSPITANVTTSNAGQVTLSGQSAGVYTQITYSVGACTSAPFSGSVTIADPGVTPLTAANVSSKSPTFCGGSNGHIDITGLSSNQSITINYKKDGVAQSPINGITDATGKIVIGSLSQANYTDITYTLGACTSAAYTGTVNMQQPELSSSQVSVYNPAVCGANTGRIELTGLGSNQSLNVNYVYNGSPQVVAVTSDATGKATITGLFSGTYTAVSYAQGACTSTVFAGPLYLANPAPTALGNSNVLGINPTQCGQTNGRIELTGLAANVSTTVTYKRNGVVQAVSVSADASGKATIPSLLAGTYSDFTYSQGACTSAPYIGPVTLTDPTPTPLTQGNVASFNPTSCTATDGRIEITGLASNVSTTLIYAKNGVSATAVVTSDNSGKATLTVGVGSYSNFSYLQGTCVSNPYAVTLTVSAVGCGRLLVNAYLQGALISNGGSLSSLGKPLMRDNLRAGGYLPLSDPYRTAAYSGLFPQINNSENQSIAASLTTVTGEKAIVDWVFVELRNKTNPAVVSYTRSGLLLRDGTVIDSDGQAGLAFSGATADNYYVAIRHRNHLGIMTQQSVSYAGTGAATTVDFITMTDSQIWNASGYDGIERSTITASSQSVRAMWAGNTVGNNKVKYSGSGSGLPVILNNIVNYPGGTGAFNYTNAYGYLNGDVNLDGRALYVGSGNDGAVILGNVIAYPLNSSGVYNYDLMLQQLP